MPTETHDDDDEIEPGTAGARERADEGMAPLVNNTGDDDDEGAATG